MRRDISDWLEGLARAGTRDTRYEDGYNRFGYAPKDAEAREKFHKELNLCSEATYKKHGFMISVLIVRSDGTIPEEEFFTLARDLGESLGKTFSHETIFYADQLRKTFAHYLK